MKAGRTLSRRARRAKPLITGGPALPALFFVTDPRRTPDPAATLARLPRGCGVIYRAFGAPGAAAQGRALARLARRRGLVLLVGGDPRLAARIGAQGVHLPERLAGRASGLRAARPAWLITVAAHSLPALIAARRSGAHAALLSAVFPSRSPSAGRPLGRLKFSALVRDAGLPVYALGGVNSKNAPELAGSGAAGLAAIEGLLGAPRT